MLYVILYAALGVVTLAIVSLAARVLREDPPDMRLGLLVVLFWPYFLAAVIVRLQG